MSTMLVIPRYTPSNHDPVERLQEEVNIMASGQGHLCGPVSCTESLSKRFLQASSNRTQHSCVTHSVFWSLVAGLGAKATATVRYCLSRLPWLADQGKGQGVCVHLSFYTTQCMEQQPCARSWEHSAGLLTGLFSQ